MQNQKAILLSVLALLLAIIACTIHIGGPDIPEKTIPVSADAAAQLQEQIQQAQEIALQTGVLTLQISEIQLTSLLASRLQNDPNSALQDPQVFLRDGQIRIYGKAHKGYFTANVAIIMSASVDEQNRPKIEIVSADFGPIPVPEGLRETIQSIVQEAYTGAVGPVATGLRLESIYIADGFMTLSGRVK